jgi:hypothetical protein
MINIDAMRWKYPDSTFRAFGELIYENIQWIGAPLTEAEIQQAETEYLDYLQNVKPLEDVKQRKIEALRNQKLDELIAPQIQAVNNAVNKSAIDAITL